MCTSQAVPNESETTDWLIDGKSVRFHTPNRMLRQLADSASQSEPETLAWLRGGRSGEVLYDVGASNGVYSLFAAVVGDLQVYAFEPEAQNYATLEMNCFLNAPSLRRRPRGYCVAIGERIGSQDIYCARYGAGYHMKILGKPVRVNETATFKPDHVQSVVSLTLDALVSVLSLPIPNLLKIDVDGAEQQVITGGNAVLRSPELRTAMIELVEPEGKSAVLVEQLAATGLRLVASHPVRHLRGGYYEGLFNCVFERSRG